MINTESIKKFIPQIICVAAGFLIYAAVTVLTASDENTEMSFVTRSGYDSSAVREVYVSGLTDEEVLMDIPVNPQRFSDGEIEEAFNKCVDELQTEILGENESLQKVYYDLILPDKKSGYGFSLDWSPEKTDLLSYDGTVKNENLESPQNMILDLKISDGSREAYYTFPVTIMPPLLTDSESRQIRFLKKIQMLDEASPAEDKIRLPDEFEGRNLRYRSTGDNDYNFIWIAGILIAVLLYLRDKQNLKENQNQKEKQMQIDYPEIVSKLMVFTGAGMSVRASWESIEHDYEKSGSGKRYAYEEICKMCSGLRTGAPESRVYRDFGRACRTKQYMKLASLLEQNRRSGAADLKAILSMEMVEAWEERKNLARRQGEEAGTKLLLPLVMMLGVVMAMIMVPAFMTF